MNVVLVTADTLRADKLGSYGNTRIETPNIDRLAGEGILFENATTVVPLTLPAHSSILTGTYPMYHGVRDNGGYYLDAEQITLAETLKENGYATGAFVAAFVLDSRWGLNQGFDRYFDDFDLAKYETVSLDSVQRRGDEVLAEALGWMDSVRQGPFFSWIHFYDAHTPYEPPEPHLSRYDGAPFGRYDGEVAYVDDLMGELMSWLEQKELADSTAIVFLGDHGESLGEHREATHGYFIYDATTHVPFILKLPSGDVGGRRVAAQVRVVDVMPTLLELLRVPIPAPVQGESLVPLVTGEVDDLELIAYSESLYPRNHYGWSELKSLRDGALHYIAAPRPELFELADDPKQQNNLAAQRARTVSEFQDSLDAMMERYSAEDIDEQAPVTMDAETHAQLAALGYLGGPSKIRIDPDKPLADPKDKIDLFNLIKRAGTDSSEGRVDEALTKIQQVLTEDPDILEAYSILGNLHVKKEEREKAIRAYQDALAREPEFKPALFGLASVYEEMGRLDDAAAGFRRLTEIDPRDNGAFFRLAGIHALKEEFEEALALLRQARDLGSDRPPLHNLMAECYIGLEQFEEAEREVEMALSMNPELPSANYNLALIREAQQDIPGAIAAYERDLEVAPRNFRTHFNVAKLYGQVGEAEKMVEHFERSIELNDQFAIGHLYLSKHYLDTGDLERSMELAQRGIELGPEPSMAPFGHFILADVYNRMGRSQDAERELAEARRLEGS
jgi:arylsulfatase A-like enzyme/Flp pilus assembly protein TadD